MSTLFIHLIWPIISLYAWSFSSWRLPIVALRRLSILSFVPHWALVRLYTALKTLCASCRHTDIKHVTRLWLFLTTCLEMIEVVLWWCWRLLSYWNAINIWRIVLVFVLDWDRAAMIWVLTRHSSAVRALLIRIERRHWAIMAHCWLSLAHWG